MILMVAVDVAPAIPMEVRSTATSNPVFTAASPPAVAAGTVVGSV